MQYWYYEYIGSPAPVFLQPQYDPFPRMCRYGSGRVLKGVVGSTSHDAGVCRRKLEEMTPSSIRWQPFTSEAFTSQELCNIVMIYSQSRHILRDVTTGNYTIYLGERCWRQLTGLSVIPYPPPSTLVVSLDDAQSWAAHGYFPMACHQLVMECDEFLWSRYWKVVGGGIRLDIRHRQVNTDEVNPAASSDPRLLPSQPSLRVEGGSYPQPAYEDLTPFFNDLSIHTDTFSARTFQMTPTIPPTQLPPFELCNPETLYEMCGKYRSGLWGYHQECDYLYDQHGYPPYHPGVEEYDAYWSQRENQPSEQGEDDDDDHDEDTVGLDDDDDSDD